MGSARLPLRDDGKIKGFGYVEFSTPDEAKSAYSSMNGSSIGGRDVTLDYTEERSGGGGGGGRGFGGGRGGDRGRGGRGGRGFGGRGGGRGAPGGAKKGIMEGQGKKVTFD